MIWNSIQLKNTCVQCRGWPTDWSLKYPNIISLPVPMLQPNDRDCLEWRDDTDMVKPFSVAVVWECIRPRNIVVPWFNVVWFSEAIHRHAFLMWLVIKSKLKTQDKMVGWNSSLICPLRESQPDSHTHLFFECSFSDQVWSRIKVLAGLSTASSSISDVVDQIVPISKRRQVRSIIAKLVIAACAYFIWQERNWRLFRL
ncbi:reverse transcriptase domain, reverse transcriptase zinc-binding domain protein [Tanacetum coccineum]